MARDNVHQCSVTAMYDETIDVSNAEEVMTPSPPDSSESGAEDGPTALDRKAQQPIKDVTARSQSVLSKLHAGTVRPMSALRRNSSAHDSELSDESDDDDDDDVQVPALEGSYDPKEFEHLDVSPDVKDVFEYITRYTPQTLELDYKLRPFVPDYIPGVGDIDAFLKVERPDGGHDTLGLTVLDEPCAAQSDPAVLHLQLRAATKRSSAKPMVVKKVENAEKYPKSIERWIHDISELHKSKPSPTVQYSRPMPDIDSLMQEWPPKFEERLNQIGLPTDNLQCDLPTFVDIICSLFDIPKFESRIESLHVLFTLYSAIKNSTNRNQNVIK